MITIRVYKVVFFSMLGLLLSSTTAAQEPSNIEESAGGSGGLGQWIAVSPMQVRRGELGLVTLRDGRVLAVGGHTSSDPRTNKTSEVYDPRTDTWGHLADLLEPRQESERPRLLAKGDVLLSGGHGSVCCDALTQVDLFDPMSRTWRPTGPMNHRRGEHVVVVLNSGDVLVAGGFDWGTETAPHAAEIYSLKTASWSVVDDFPEPGLVNIAVRLKNGNVLIKGDKDSTRCYLFDPATSKFTETGSMLTSRLRPTFTLLPDGWVLAAGGRLETGATSSVEIYDPATKKWSKTANMNQARLRHSATLLNDGRVLVAGGKDNSRAHDSAEIYDPKKETWSNIPKMTNRRTSHDATLLHDGRVLVAGGWSTVVAGRTLLKPTLSSAEIFDPAAR